MAETQYRSFTGAVQFDPREGTAAGKAVRNITIRATGVKEQSMRVSATLWPSHAHVKIEKGEVVFVEGKFTRNEGDKNGEKVFYNNLSVSAIRLLGKVDEGREVETENASADEPTEDDDIPY